MCEACGLCSESAIFDAVCSDGADVTGLAVTSNRAHLLKSER